MTKINLNINDGFLKKLDEISKKENMNRSEFIREAVENFMAIKQEEESRQIRKKKIEDAIQFFGKMSRKNKDWDGVKEISKWRESRKIN
ncbi:MAG: ribbon-helix-helix domain-containing protein [Actinomycetota bacterium]|nr:ribbon-helix-helix domain-containing protein [Actinomycetota bacterium]